MVYGGQKNPFSLTFQNPLSYTSFIMMLKVFLYKWEGILGQLCLKKIK
jgi:hypothetical protein